MESTRDLVQQISLISSAFSPFFFVAIILVVLIYGIRFFRVYLENQENTQRILLMQMEQTERTRSSLNASPGSHTNITIAGDPAAPGGYDFVQVPDEFKSVFLEAMGGFRDYAKLRGYSVDLSVDTSLPGKVGMRITIVDIGVTVSTTTVRKDVDDYLRRFKDGDDFDDLPVPENSAEHLLLVSALKLRFSHLKSQMEIQKFKTDLLMNMINDLKSTGLSAIGYPPPHSQILQLTLQNDGGNNMRDRFEANNSQNIAQGKNSSAYTSDSSIQIGHNHSERSQRIEALREFLREAQESELPTTIKGEVVRYIENAKEELETAEQPDGNEVGKWLDRANKAVSTASAGAGLVDKVHDLLTKFGMS